MQAVIPEIDNLVKQIVETAHPLRIVLFGSAARGEMRQDSDVDLLIVMPEGTNCDEISGILWSRVGGVKVAFDLVIATPTLLDKYRDNCALVYKWALDEGREIYAA